MIFHSPLCTKKKTIVVIILLVVILPLTWNTWIFNHPNFEFISNTSTNDHVTNAHKNKNVYCAERSLNILIVSIHDGARLDLPSILSSMCHNIFLHSVKMSQSPYPLAFTTYNFTILPENAISPYFKNKFSSYSEQEISGSYDFYTQKENRYILSSIDLIVCSYPSASLCEGWIPFNKSLLINSGHRYDFPSHEGNNNKWQLLNRNLKYLLNLNKYLGFDKYTIAGNNLYDNYYINYYLNHNNEFKNYFLDNYIPTSGTLYTSLYLQNDPQFKFKYINYTLYHSNISLKSVRKYEILIAPKSIGKGKNRQTTPTINKILQYNFTQNTFKLMLLSQKYQRFESYDLIKHPAIILLPYSVHSYGITDIYSLNIPTFVPTMTFLHANNVLYDFGNYNGAHKPKAVNNTYLKKYPQPPRRWKKASTYPLDQFAFWVNKSDFFVWKHYIYFDSLQHLDELLQKMEYPTDYISVSNCMKQFNDEKLEMIKHALSNILSPIQQRSTAILPNVSYHQAIQQIFHNESLNFLEK